VNDEQQTLETIRKELAEMAEDDRIRVMAIAETFRNAIRAGKPHAYMAIGLVGAEVAAEVL
jgi:hypothetical protein